MVAIVVLGGRAVLGVTLRRRQCSIAIWSPKLFDWKIFTPWGFKPWFEDQDIKRSRRLLKVEAAKLNRRIPLDSA